MYPRPAERRRARIALLSLLALLLSGLALSPAQSAHAADNGRWAVFPSTVKKAPERAYFQLKTDPGSTLKDKVTISNRTRGPITFVVYPADAYNTKRDGGFAVRSLDEKQEDVGSWVHLSRTEVKVPARDKVTIPFTIKVPGDAAPGDHAGGILALDKKVTQVEGKSGVGVQRAVGARIYLQVNGERTPQLSVENVQFDYSTPLIPGFGEDATVTYTLVNRGNVMLEPQVDLKAKGVFGRTSLDVSGKKLPAELLPGERVDVTQKWSGPPFMDWGDIQLTASDKGGELVETGSTPFRTANWVTLLLAAALLALAVAGWLIRRRRNARSAAGTSSEDSSAPAGQAV